ncbi:unnamed protein product [Fusarium langsethiae]|nr:unnamed protein product [Fusarium langsethiae]
MLKSSLLPLSRQARRPVTSVISCLPVRSINGFHNSRRNQQKESQGRNHHESQSNRPVLLASTLSITATTVAGGILLSLLGYSSREDGTDSHYATRKQMELAVEEIRQSLGEDAVSIEDEILHSHGYSDWSTINIDRLPVAVTFPASTKEVATIARICHKRRVPMIPYSGGSSVEGHFSAPFGGVSVDFVNMNQILQVHADDLNVVVQPSVPWMDLNEQIKDTGLFFPIDPGPSVIFVLAI